MTPDEVERALGHRAVLREVQRVVRDERVRATFARMRGAGVPVVDALSALTGPHLDVDGRPYFLSDARIRAIVYPRRTSR